jgi:hypothetical protein
MLTVLQSTRFRKDEDYYRNRRSDPIRRSSKSRYNHYHARSAAFGFGTQEAFSVRTQ